MSDTSNGVEWVETTEEVVITEECLPPESNTSGTGVIKVLVILCYSLTFNGGLYSYITLSPYNCVFVLPVVPVLVPAETPIQKLLETVGHGDNPEADNGFCKRHSFLRFLYVQHL